MLFAQVFGIYLILSGVLVLVKQEHIVSVGRLFGKDEALRFSMGALLTLGGLFMVLSYSDWSTTASSIITVVGWLVLLKGVVAFFVTESQFMKMMKVWGGYYAAWGVIALIAGGYLALLGFGLM